MLVTVLSSCAPSLPPANSELYYQKDLIVRETELDKATGMLVLPKKKDTNLHSKLGITQRSLESPLATETSF